jgi:hypothetical protein
MALSLTIYNGRRDAPRRDEMENGERKEQKEIERSFIFKSAFSNFEF